MPPGASTDALRILAARGVRAFADGFVSLLLPIYLLERGFDVLAISAIITATLIGSALLTLCVGMIAYRHKRRHLIVGACLLMAATGAGFVLARDFWPLLVVAFVGTMNPSSGDVSVFLPLEHTMLAQTIEPRRRTALFARYSLVGALAGAVGTLAAAFPDLAVAWSGRSHLAAMQAMFGLYGALGLAALLLYRPLSPAVEAVSEAPPAPLKESKTIVYGLTALFSIDAFGGGFFVQSLLALWLYQAFALSVTAAASILFWTSICSAVSYLLAVPISERIGLVNTMVFTHLPSNLFLMLVPFAPNLATAIGLLLARSALSQMDVPTRTSYVMAVVTPEERPAAASLTAVPRSFASALSPLLAGYLFTLSTFGWPLIIGGALKAIYDLLLLAKFRKLRPPEETVAAAR
ncbi:Predicted arabinose efflux permease, MFS family [Rhizobiales bacterium GAS191]|nr:Predicted arabinose efflux permease, MFS family [Rhizobiales bacterium GAS188]SEE55122.1 Predicted arabinose efflux permease, MFS family [Rhizobiales bacterium GAS191]